MLRESFKNKVLLVLNCLGFLVAISAGVSEHISFLQALCSDVSAGCRETAEIELFRTPIWMWGAGFYAIITLTLWKWRQFTPWFAAAAFGVEMALVWIMAAMKAVCLFCILNLLVVALLVAFAFKKDLLWQMVSMGLLGFAASILLIPLQNRTLSSIALRAESSPIVADLGDELITEDKLEVISGSRVYELKKEIYKLKRDKLEQRIADAVLQKEASKRGMPVERLVDAELFPNGVKVTEEEIDLYYRQNIERLREWSGTHEELMNRIKDYLERDKRYNEVMKYAKSLEQKHGVKIFLTEPKPSLMHPNIEKNPSLGSKDAPVTVVEFSDYQCPACRATHSVIQKLREHYGAGVRWVFKDYPLKKHPNAAIAAEAARCAGDQGKFWEYQDLLYASKEALTPELLESNARNLGIAGDLFSKCLQDRRYKQAVESDVLEAGKLGINSTPSFVINGRFISGGPGFEGFQKIIDEEMKKKEPKK